MRTPSQEQFQTVIDNLEKANEIVVKGFGYASVDMSEPHPNYCGSPMCFGGWYVVAKSKRDTLDFHDGACLIAEDLGFENGESQLTWWAFENDRIWGNKNGSDMFYSKFSFLDGYTEITNLSQIIDHWKGVKERAANP